MKVVVVMFNSYILLTIFQGPSVCFIFIYKFLRAASGTKSTTNWVALNNRNSFSQFWRLEVQNQDINMFFLKALGENLFHVFLLASGIAGNLWCSLAYRCNTPVSACHMTFSLCVSLLCLFSFSYNDSSHIGFWAYPTPVRHHLNFIASAKALFANEVTFTGTGCQDSTYLLGGTQFNP